MSLFGQYYVERSVLYSQDGKRRARVCEFDSGETYLDEQEWVEETRYENRHNGDLVGPFKSPEDAKKFIITTEWFRGQKA